jgi:hypothetical protein
MGTSSIRNTLAILREQGRTPQYRRFERLYSDVGREMSANYVFPIVII